MFYSQFILAKKGPLGTIWIAAHLERKLRKNQVADTDIGVSVDSILFPEAPIALRLSSHLLLGVVRIYSRKVNYLFDDCSEALLKVKQAFRSAAVDLPPEESTAPYHLITLPETFDLDDFELPDNEIFQGNYVDHHVSTREQITLQDTMDGVVYSTSQFGLDERFGDGDTSQVALDLDEVFQEKDVIGSEDEGVPDTDQNAYMEAATPVIKDATVGVSEAMPDEFNDEHQAEDVAMYNELMEDVAQAPQTPGLVEVLNSSSVREQLACDDHMEVEDHNASEEVRKASEELVANEIHKPEEELASEHNATEEGRELEANEMHKPEEEPLTVTPMELEKSQLDENANAQNEPEDEEERAEVTTTHVTSPCHSHITTETEDPRQANVDNVVAEVPPIESFEGPIISNIEHCLSHEPNNQFTIVSEVNKETYEELSNANATDSEFPAPETVLAAPTNELADGNGIINESTPDKEDAENNNNITGKKRTFTESTLTAESLNSVESVGLIQSKRTAVPDDDDLLSSILVGKSSFLKMRPTPVLELATAKRQRAAPRSTVTKRKVLMDDPMVLHGDVIRQQLTDTEGIRRVRKKAPCTIPEIVMLQRQAFEDGLFKEPIFTGMSVELVSLHNEPFDLRGIIVIEDDAFAGVEEDNECSVREVEENKNEETSAVPQDDNNTQEEEIIEHHEETKDDNDLVEKVSEMEVLHEGEETANVVVNEEDRQDHVEELQVEGFHEIQDGVLDSEDICANVSTDVIEIAEGDIDNNDVIVNETDLKVEDELPHECEKTDTSAEVEVEEQTPCDNTTGSIETECVVAGEISNLPLESCNEPLVEASNDDVVNPEMEPDNKYEPNNEMFNEETFMQDTEHTSRDGLFGDNDEMNTMEVEHDTGFLNVDDEVDEDHEDDGEQDGEETRLLENSGWSSRTRAVAKYMQTLFDKEAENGKNVLVADKLLAGKTRKEASRMFFETLVLKTRDYIQVEQAKPYENIVIKPRPRLTKSIF